MSNTDRTGADLESARAAGEPNSTAAAIAARLEPDERLHRVLRGRVLDLEADDADAREETRTRKVASRGRDLLTVVTDDRLLFVVQRPEGTDHEFLSVPYASATDVRLETAGGDRRLVVRGPERYYVDVGSSPEAACTDALERIRAGIESAPDADASTSDPLAALERLAALHERGALTDAEFAAKKRALLDRL